LDGDSEKAYYIKSNVLTFLRHIVKSDAVYDLVKKENPFYVQMAQFCRDGTHFKFNQAAWKLFYRIIYYHYGALDNMMKSNSLTPFFELVGTNSSSAVIINGLHAIGKLYLMYNDEQRRIQEGKPPIRIDKEALKLFEKDIKTLSKYFIDRSLFIKIHMIYKKLNPRINGAPFLELANFYHILCTIPSCSKLYKHTTKKTEYLTGIEEINKMYTGYPDLEECPPGIKTPRQKTMHIPAKASSMLSMLSPGTKHKD